MLKIESNMKLPDLIKAKRIDVIDVAQEVEIVCPLCDTLNYTIVYLRGDEHTIGSVKCTKCRSVLEWRI